MQGHAPTGLHAKQKAQSPGPVTTILAHEKQWREMRLNDRATHPAAGLTSG